MKPQLQGAAPATLLRRRTFVQGLAATAAGAAGLSGPVAYAQSVHAASVLSGTEFDLRIGETEVNITGRRRRATTVNGSLPAPLLRWKEGTTVTLRVTNTLPVTSSIHWHGLIVPPEMDGVPGLSFDGIAPGETYVYRFAVQQSGTYWYHSHSAFQEQTGLYGPIVIDPAGPDPVQASADHVLILSDWTDEDPVRVYEKLKAMGGYYNYQVPTVGDFFRDAATLGFSGAWERRKMWQQMRMNPTDLADVTAATYTYLVNGQPPAANYTVPARQGERVRLRVINAGASMTFDVRIPGLQMTVVSADGQPVRPVAVDEFRIAPAETFDVIVTPAQDRAYTFFAQGIDRMGYARATLAPRAGMVATVPPLDPPMWLDMEDMGMGDMHGMDHGAAPQAQQSPGPAEVPSPSQGHAGHGGAVQGMQGMQGMAPAGSEHGAHSGHQSQPTVATANTPAPMATPAPGHAGHGQQAAAAASQMYSGKSLDTGPAVDSRTMSPGPVINDPGPRLRRNGRRVLVYSDLHTIGGPVDPRPPSRDIVLRLTGNMERFIWGFDGKKYSESEPIRIAFRERVRFVLINDTMMSHPIHVHGMWSEVETVDRQFLVRKHTVNVHPGKYITFLSTGDVRGQWAFHCHQLYHMEAGMFRKVVVE